MRTRRSIPRDTAGASSTSGCARSVSRRKGDHDERDTRCRRTRRRRQASRHGGARPLRCLEARRPRDQRERHLFEETVPAGTKSLFHLHRGSDEVAWVLAGEITFKIGDEVTVGGPGTCAFLPRNVAHAWKNTGTETGRVVFLYTPAAAGGYVEELRNRPSPMTDDERKELRERYQWEIVGPNPL